MIAKSPNLILVAKCIAPSGLQGEIKLKSFMADPLKLKAYPVLFSHDAAVSFTVTMLKLYKEDVLIARLEGIRDRTRAERLKGVSFYIPRETFPELSEEEYYYEDLLGLFAQKSSGNKVGIIKAVHNFGAGDVLEIEGPEGGETFFYPFTKEAVPEVNLRKGFILIDEDLWASLISS